MRVTARPTVRSERQEFLGSRGEPLAARLDLPETTPRAYAVIAHCFTCSKESAAASRLSRGLTERGIGVLRFDFTGLGESGGDFANTSFSSNVDDLVAAVGHLGSIGRPPQLLVGHSLGGAAVIAAAALLPQIRAVVTVGAPCSPDHVTGLLGDAVHDVRRDGEAEVVLGGRRFTVRRSFLDDVAEQPQARRLAALGRPLLVMHSPQDEIVPVDEARRIFAAAAHPKSFVSLDGADHLLTRRADAGFVAGVIAAWAERYVVGDDSADDPSALPETGSGGRNGQHVADGSVVVSGSGPGLTHTVTARRHTWPADEPLDVGGTDAGPTPYELLLAALGSCTAMTLRLYAQCKGWDLGDVEVALRHDRVHADDCAGCEEPGKRLDRISREITIAGALTSQQRQALARIADRCPVHRTLTGQVRIETQLS